MSLTNPNTPVSQQDLQDFYHKILPYMGGSSEGGGHTIEDAEGTDLTQRDILQFGEGLSATDDSTNEKTVVDIDPMPAEDMDDVIDELPTGGNMAVAGYVPLGTLIPYYGETAPKFFLACDGSTYNKVDYPELANHLLSLTNNTPYIVDGDNTKFKVPDLRGEFIRGTGTNSHTNQGSGDTVGTHQDATLIHNTLYNEGALEIQITGIQSGNTWSPNYNYDYTRTPKNGVGAKGTYQIDGATDYGAGTTRPTNTSVLYCIAYKDIYSNPMNDYSTTEKVVGTWIDGKPLYQKTVDCGYLANTGISEVNISTMMTTVDFIVTLNGIAVNESTKAVRPLPFADGQEVSNSIRLDISLGNNQYFLRTVTATNWGVNAYRVYATIQYTKTTD